jgi:hypothetical protein
MEFIESIPQLMKPTFKENSTLPYLGRNYQAVQNLSRSSLEIPLAYFRIWKRSGLDLEISSNTKDVI